jgi:hypothetical protein
MIILVQPIFDLPAFPNLYSLLISRFASIMVHYVRPRLDLKEMHSFYKDMQFELHGIHPFIASNLSTLVVFSPQMLGYLPQNYGL